MDRRCASGLLGGGYPIRRQRRVTKAGEPGEDTAVFTQVLTRRRARRDERRAGVCVTRSAQWYRAERAYEIVSRVRYAACSIAGYGLLRERASASRGESLPNNAVA